MVIPDWCLLLLFLFTALWHPVNVLMAFICLIIAFAAKYLIRSGRNSLGYGDIKFMTIAGFFMVTETLPVFLIVTGLAGIGIALISKHERFPFGPAIATGLGVVLGYA